MTQIKKKTWTGLCRMTQCLTDTLASLSLKSFAYFYTKQIACTLAELNVQVFEL